MALPDNLVIAKQPEANVHPPTAIHEETHYNGEEIIFEATCDEANLKEDIKQHYVNAALQMFLTGVGGLVVCRSASI